MTRKHGVTKQLLRTKRSADEYDECILMQERVVERIRRGAAVVALNAANLPTQQAPDCCVRPILTSSFGLIPSRVVHSRMQFTLHATRRTPRSQRFALLCKQSIPTWSVKTRRAPSRHRVGARVYGPTSCDHARACCEYPLYPHPRHQINRRSYATGWLPCRGGAL